MACHPWGDPAEWYCFHCFTQWEIREMTNDLQRILFRQNIPGAATEAMGRATRQALQDTTLLPLIIEFLGTGFEQLHWDAWARKMQPLYL